MAVQTFSIVPEAYQQVFVENGVNFPDELVAAIKKDPTQASQLLENDKQLKNEVVQIFKANKDAILKAAQNNTPSMKNGGKILGVMKFQLGGKYSVKNGDYSASVQAPGDTLRTKVYPYTTREMQTYPNGNTRYTVYGKSYTQNYWSPQSKPNFLQRLWYGTKTVPVDEAQNWEQIVKNHPEDPRNIRKQQNGGDLNQAPNPFAGGLVNIMGVNVPIDSNNVARTGIRPDTKTVNQPISNDPYLRGDHYLFGKQKMNQVAEEQQKKLNLIQNMGEPNRNVYNQSSNVIMGQEGMVNPTVYNNVVLPKNAPERKTGARYTLNSLNRGGGGNTSDYGEVIKDENGLSYRDVRDTN